MRCWTVLRPALLLPLFLGTACVTEQGPSSLYAPVQATWLASRTGKPPLQFHTVRLQITNHQDRAMWYLVPESTEVKLPERGTFTLAEKSAAELLEWQASGGPVLEVALRGTGFRAFRLPPQGKLQLTTYEVTANRDTIAVLDVMEARDLYADGKPIEQALGRDVQCGKDVKVGAMHRPEAKVLAKTTDPITTLHAEEFRFWMPKVEK